jgi:hypothetical protein
MKRKPAPWTIKPQLETATTTITHHERQHWYYANLEKDGKSSEYGHASVVVDAEREICFGNKRFRMCFSQPFLICDPQSWRLQWNNE